MTRAASSQALARATASAAKRDAAGPLFEGLAAACAGCSWSGSFWANAPDPSAAMRASATHRNGFAIGQSFRPSRRRIMPDGEGLSHGFERLPLAAHCALSVARSPGGEQASSNADLVAAATRALKAVGMATENADG